LIRTLEGLERHQKTHLLLQLVDLRTQQRLLLVRVDSVGHELEVGVVFAAELLQEPVILLLHFVVRLASQLDLVQQRFFLLRMSKISANLEGN
jgi:hypothetical protein